MPTSVIGGLGATERLAMLCATEGGVENVQYATNHKRNGYGWLRTVRFQRPLATEGPNPPKETLTFKKKKFGKQLRDHYPRALTIISRRPHRPCSQLTHVTKKFRANGLCRAKDLARTSILWSFRIEKQELASL